MRGPAWIPLVLLSLGLLSAAEGYCADVSPPQNLTLDGLKALLTQRPAFKASFRETRESGLLEIPIEANGILEYRPGDFFKKEILTPEHQVITLQGEQVTLTDPGGVIRQFSAADYPPLQALTAALRAMTGDLDGLHAHFALKLQGTPHAWQLTLNPMYAETRRLIDTLILSGEGGQVTRVETFEASGDHSLLRIEPLHD